MLATLAVRLANRRLERLSVKAFGAAAFLKLTVDLSADSLRLIRNIANHDEFRLAVHNLRFGERGEVTETEYSYQNPIGLNGHWPRLEDGRVDRECESVRQFVDSLSRFLNCTGTSSPHALSVPGAPLLRCFQASIARGLDWIPPGLITRAAAAPVENLLAARLEEITLELEGADDECAANLLHLATACRHLRKLRLGLRGGGGPATESRLTRHLDRVPRFTPALETLRIRSPMMSEANLLRLLSQSGDTLTKLDLSVGLSAGSWTTILGHLQAATHFQSLRRFTMFACSDGPANESIAFCPLWKNREALSELPRRLVPVPY